MSTEVTYRRATRRNREDRHNSRYAVDCLAGAPASVKREVRSSIRAAGRAALPGLLAEALEELEELRELGELPRA